MQLNTADATDVSGDFKVITGTTIGTKRAMDVSSVGGAPVTTPAGAPVVWDTITLTTGATTDTYTYTLSAATVLVITITYTDSTKETISTVVKTLS